MDESISRQAAVDILEVAINDDWEFDYAKDRMLELPTSLERKKGEWVDMADFEQCSVCRGTHLKEFQSYYGKTIWVKSNFCPNCGADMRGEQDD